MPLRVLSPTVNLDFQMSISLQDFFESNVHFIALRVNVIFITSM